MGGGGDQSDPPPDFGCREAPRGLSSARKLLVLDRKLSIHWIVFFLTPRTPSTSNRFLATLRRPLRYATMTVASAHIRPFLLSRPGW